MNEPSVLEQHIQCILGYPFCLDSGGGDSELDLRSSSFDRLHSHNRRGGWGTREKTLWDGDVDECFWRKVDALLCEFLVGGATPDRTLQSAV